MLPLLLPAAALAHCDLVVVLVAQPAPALAHPREVIAARRRLKSGGGGGEPQPGIWIAHDEDLSAEWHEIHRAGVVCVRSDVVVEVVCAGVACGRSVAHGLDAAIEVRDVYAMIWNSSRSFGIRERRRKWLRNF